MKCKWINRPGLLFLIPVLLSFAVCFMVDKACAAPAEKEAEIEQKAMDALGEMGKYLMTLKSFSVDAATSRDEVLLSGQKVMVDGTTMLTVRRPDRLYVATRIDEIGRDIKFYYDGSMFTLFGNKNKYYASFKAPATIGLLMELAESKYDIEFPLRDLFAWGTADSGAENIKSAFFVAATQVDGVLCNHYAFRQEDVDWQIWIEQGKTPLPKKIVITSKLEEGQPEYISIMKWNLSPKMSASDFIFTPPEGSYEIEFKSYVEATK